MPARRRGPQGRSRAAPAWWRRPAIGVGLPLIIGIIHVAVVAPYYFVGSFDDDSSYILTARALEHGQGLTGHLTSGVEVVSLYPPGFGALLVPLEWLWPHTFVPLRLFSLAAFAALFPLTWIYLERRGVGEGARTATLVVLALGPPIATYGSMVMAETTFLVVLMLLLLAVDRWEADGRLWTASALATILLSGALVWIKQAGIGVVAGLVLWLLLRHRRWAPGRRGTYRALALVAGVVVLLLPVLIARAATGVPLDGGRYSAELGAFYQGGMVRRITHVLPGSTWHLLSTALPATLIPYLRPLPIHGHWVDLWKIVSWQVTIFAGIGAVTWWRRHRDATLVAVPVYLAESVLWPYVNERRTILVLPILVAWYVLGAWTAWAFVRSGVANRHRLAVHGAQAVAVVAVVGLAVVPLSAQFGRDYLFDPGQDSSHFGGSRYAEILARLGPPSSVVETDYLSSTALFTGHLTNWHAFIESSVLCYLPAIDTLLASDDAGFMLIGDLNKPGVIDSPCLLKYAALRPSWVELLHTSRDDGTVFELIGPGTGHPDLSDLTGQITPTASGAGDASTLEWDWSQPRPVIQATIGQASMSAGTTRSMTLQLHRADGTWVTVDSSPAAVGDGKGFAPFLAAQPGNPMTATGMRLVATGDQPGATLTVSDAVALASTGPGAN